MTQLLNQWSAGDQSVEAELIEKIYPYLYQSARKQLCKEFRNITLQTTEIVNEVYIKLRNDQGIQWQSEVHFRALSAGIIRRILVDHFRNKNRIKRGGDKKKVTYDRVVYAIADERQEQFDWLDLHEKLNTLGDMDDLCGRIVELRYFGGLTIEEVAQECQVSVSTAVRNWRFARGWLRNQLTT